MTPAQESYFSISFDLITINQAMAYDLYINLSTQKGQEKFLKIFRKGDPFQPSDLEKFKAKYKQVYVSESQRGDYLKSLVKSSGRNDDEKATVIKDSAIHYLEGLFHNDKEFSTELLAQSIGGCREVVENMVDVIHNYDIDQLQNLIGRLSFHDFYTYDHSINVSMYSILLFQYAEPKASRQEIIQAGLGGLLHDLGKIKIPTEIINKPGKLTDEEFSIIKLHPDYGKTFMVDPAMKLPGNIDPMTLARVIHEHHENYDGSGYPSKVKGESIHLLARITAIADFFDAITTKRSYHQALTTQDAIALMGKSKGAKLDPKLFEIFSQHTQTIAANRPCNYDLAPDFDPCQPHDHLPITQAADGDHDHAKKDDKKFGGIRVMGDTGSWGVKNDQVKKIDRSALKTNHGRAKVYPAKKKAS